MRSKRPPFRGALANAVITGAAELWVAAKDSTVDDTLTAAYGVASAYNPRPDGTLEKLRAARVDLDRRYVNRVRLGGIKFWLDGSLATAWFTQPYATNPPGKTGSYSGFRQIPDEVVDAAFHRFWPPAVHLLPRCPGVAAALDPRARRRGHEPHQQQRAGDRARQEHVVAITRPSEAHRAETWPRFSDTSRLPSLRRFHAIPARRPLLDVGPSRNRFPSGHQGLV